MEKYIIFIFWLLIIFIRAEERLSWSTSDIELRKSIFVPDNLPEGKEENRVLPWVFHDDKVKKEMKLKCMMRGYNASNNPIEYKDARWSHPGFDINQVNTSAKADKGEENGVPYAIWTITIHTSADDAGKKWATCEFQQGDFPLSTDFRFLIFKKTYDKFDEENNHILSYSLGEYIDKKDINLQIEDDIKRQISEHYNMTLNNVIRSNDGQKFNITISTDETLTSTTTTTTKTTSKTSATSTTSTRTTTTEIITPPTTKKPITKPSQHKPNQIVVDATIKCDQTPFCYPERQRLYEMMCPNYKLIKVKVCSWGQYFELQYCYCTNPRIVERTITHISYFKIPDPILQPRFYYRNELVVENVIQCEPTPTPYCYKERQERIERKYPNYQIIEIWRFIYRIGFELQYCYCTNAKIVQTKWFSGKNNEFFAKFT